ncbi:hypothetical protein ACFYNO_40540 [Kitasatospora sp. NPDC006697]|uniref:hypothetical protein n=1 Tax=Kitasatospora sp. NPDC006697 TaxID=3364020 RepID=UPI00367A6D86
MAGEVVQLAEVAPYVTAALAAYGNGVLHRAEDAAVGATANLGLRIVQRVFRRGRASEQEALQTAVREAVDEPGDADAAAALRQQIRRALREDAELAAELAQWLRAAGPGAITAAGERSVATRTNHGIISTGDGFRNTGGPGGHAS